MYRFRDKAPVRTCGRKFRRYKTYKKFLVVDFHNRCGYCNGSDTWHGGYKSFHIDHFAPKDKFPELEVDYLNLIYACPSCNLSKSNKWPSEDPKVNVVNEKGFLNPAVVEFNDHFQRDVFGNIIGVSNIAKNMIIDLNLHLERHAVIWMLTKLEELIVRYKEQISKLKTGSVLEQMEEMHYKLLLIFFEYHGKLKSLNI